MLRAQKRTEKLIKIELKNDVTTSRLVLKWLPWINTTQLGMRGKYKECNTPESHDLGMYIIEDLIKA